MHGNLSQDAELGRHFGLYPLSTKPGDEGDLGNMFYSEYLATQYAYKYDKRLCNCFERDRISIKLDCRPDFKELGNEKSDFLLIFIQMDYRFKSY